MFEWRKLTGGLVGSKSRINHQSSGCLIPEGEGQIIVVVEELAVGVWHGVDLVEELLARENLVCDVTGDSDVREIGSQSDLRGLGIDHQVDL